LVDSIKFVFKIIYDLIYEILILVICIEFNLGLEYDVFMNSKRRSKWFKKSKDKRKIKR